MSAFIIALLIVVGILNLTIGLGVLSRNVHKTLNITFFVLALGVGFWVLGIAAFLATKDSALALHWAQFYYVPPLLIVASSVAFADTFPAGDSVNRKRFAFVAAGFVALVAVHLLDPHWLLGHVVYHSWGKEVTLNPLPYTLYAIYLAIVFSLTLATIYTKARTERGLYRLQSNVFFNGYLVSCLLGVLFNLFLPGLGNYRWIWIGPLASSFYVGATAYGIIKHRLFDIRPVIARTLGYLFSLIVLSSIYGFVVFGVLTLVFNFNISVQVQIVISAMTGVAALIFSQLKHFFDRLTNRLFYRDAYDPQTFIDELNRVLVASITLDGLLRDSADVIAKNLKVEYCGFGIRETKFSAQRFIGTADKKFSTRDIEEARRLTPYMSPIIAADFLPPEQEKLRRLMERNDIAVLVRLAPRQQAEPQEGLGYIVLGRRKSGNPYANQDLKMLDILGRELMIAIQNTLHFEEIENFNITLKQEIERATSQLRRSNEKLRKLDQTKDDFISMASHQLRTPLTSVKGYVSMVLDGDGGPLTVQQKKLLNQSFISAQRMVYLISDLLNVSRLRTGKFVIEPIPTNLANVIQDEVKQLVETAKGRDLELTYHRPDHFPTLLMDETKMRQVIMNFIDNAIYYTPSGGHITINLIEKPKTIEFTVVDDGIGVPRHEQHHLFSKFYRAGNAKQARPDGTGLGLFMAKKVIVAQGGAIIFKSEEGKGSTFGFTFAKAPLLAKDNVTSV